MKNLKTRFKERKKSKGRDEILDSAPKTKTESGTAAVKEVVRSIEDSHIFSVVTFVNVMHGKWRRILLVTLLCGLLLVIGYALNSVYTVNAIMSLNFEESTIGKNPNGTRFNISQLRSLDVTQIAVEKAGLKGKIEPRKISDSISITPYTNDLGSEEKGYYISSSYYITFKMPPSLIGKISANDMFDMIFNSYKETLYNECIVTYRAVDESEIDFDKMDYGEIGMYFDMMTSRFNRYLDMRIREAGAYFTQDGENFRSLDKLVTNLIDYDLQNYNSYIWENGISKDKEQQIDTLNYVNHRLSWKYIENMKENEARTSTIEKYNNAMTSFVMIPTYDENNEFYMSRTKTGIDTLARDADKKIAEAKANQLEMSLNEDKISKLKANQADDNYETADKMVKNIRKKLSDISDKISDVDKEYVHHKTRNYITINTGYKSFLDKIHIKRVIFFMVIVFVIMYVFYAVKRKVDYKNSIEAALSSDGKEGDK